MSHLRLLLALLLLFATFAFAQPAIIVPLTPLTTTYAFPLVGVASSESIEVNLINSATNSAAGTAAFCTGSVTFTSVSGGTSIGGTGTFSLAAGAVGSFLPSVLSTVIAPGARVLVRAVVQTTTTAGVPCSLGSTLNTFDTATGVTHVFLVGNAPFTAQPLTISILQ